LICTNNSIHSEWVKLEYETFYSQCFIRNQSIRRLILLPLKGFDLSHLPPFLKNIQVSRSIKEIIPILGGIDIQTIKNENIILKKDNDKFRLDIKALKKDNDNLARQINDLKFQLALNFTIQNPISTLEGLKNFIEFIAKHLMDYPDDVKVEIVEGEITVVYELWVNEEEKFIVEGSKENSKVIRALRTLVSQAGIHLKKRAVLELIFWS
jgi:predicted RNA-binding protein YlqC (UPF0109 family)